MREFKPALIVSTWFSLAQGAAAGAPEIEWTASYNGPGSYWESTSDAVVRDA